MVEIKDFPTRSSLTHPLTPPPIITFFPREREVQAESEL